MAGRPVLSDTVGSTEADGVVETEPLEGESVPTMKPIEEENWAGPASRRRDSIGAPVVNKQMY